MIVANWVKSFRLDHRQAHLKSSSEKADLTAQASGSLT
jgi:hypothetical protein